MMDVKGLSKEDLYLLMESYKNMITLNATLAEQQKQLMENQTKIFEKQDHLAARQQQFCDRVNLMIDRIERWTADAKMGHDEIQNTCTGLEENLGEQLEGIKTSNNQMIIDNTKSHASLKNHIYGAYVGMGSMIVSILTLVYLVFSHNDKASDIFNLLQKVALKLGVQIISQ